MPKKGGRKRLWLERGGRMWFIYIIFSIINYLECHETFYLFFGLKFTRGSYCINRLKTTLTTWIACECIVTDSAQYHVDVFVYNADIVYDFPDVNRKCWRPLNDFTGKKARQNTYPIAKLLTLEKRMLPRSRWLRHMWKNIIIIYFFLINTTITKTCKAKRRHLRDLRRQCVAFCREKNSLAIEYLHKIKYFPWTDFAC